VALTRPQTTTLTDTAVSQIVHSTFSTAGRPAKVAMRQEREAGAAGAASDAVADAVALAAAGRSACSGTRSP